MTHKGRVLHLIDTRGPGGAETVFLDLVTHLPSLGWEAVTATSGTGWLAESLRSAGMTSILMTSQRTFDLGYVRKLRRVLRDERIDLVQTHLLGTSVYAALACAGTRTPVVSTFHGRPDIRRSERFRRIKVGLLRGNSIVCVSDSLRKHLVGLGNFDDRIQVVHNGVDLSQFEPGRRTQLRSELGIPADGPLVGAVGNIRMAKAYHVLLDAFAHVRSIQPRAQLVIAGHPDSEIYEHLMAQCAKLDLSGSTHFLGFREDILEVLGALDVFALSSTDEGFSLATVQAMAVGLSIVGTLSGGPEEIVGNSGAAILVPPNDPRALGSAIIRVLEDDELSSALKEAARERAEHFSLDKMLDRYDSLYQRVLNRH
jgi:glycosyltransferase involved in cell wall biosynthesis